MNMNSTQIGITAATIFVIAAISATALKSMKPSSLEYAPRRFPTDEYIYNLNPSYKSVYDADRREESRALSEELDFDRPGYNADRKAHDPTMPVYDPFRNTSYKPMIGGTRCVDCHNRLRYTRRK